MNSEERNMGDVLLKSEFPFVGLCQLISAYSNKVS